MTIRASTIVTAIAFGGVRGRSHLGERVTEDLPWPLSLHSRMTPKEGKAAGRGTPPPLVIYKIGPIFVKIRYPLRFLKIFIILKKRDF